MQRGAKENGNLVKIRFRRGAGAQGNATIGGSPLEGFFYLSKKKSNSL